MVFTFKFDQIWLCLKVRFVILKKFLDFVYSTMLFQRYLRNNTVIHDIGMQRILLVYFALDVEFYSPEISPTSSSGTFYD